MLVGRLVGHLMDTDALFFAQPFVHHDYPSSAYNTAREKADERLYNVRRILLLVTSFCLVHSRNDEKAKKKNKKNVHVLLYS